METKIKHAEEQKYNRK